MRKALLIFSVGLVCLLLAMWGCERHITGSGGGGSGTVSTLSISAEDTVLATPAGVIDSTTITVTVTDAGGVGVPGQSVEMYMDTNVGLLRSISADTTDYNGQISTVFRVNANFGSNVIHARVGSAAAQLAITVNQVNIAQVTVQAAPNILNVAPGTTAQCSIAVWIRDDMGNGVANVMPSLRCSRGIIQNFIRSDNSGRVSTVYHTSGDLSQYGVDTVLASVGDRNSTTTITINQTAGLTGSITMNTNLNVIYADGPGITSANVFALLKDADNQVISNDTVIFTSTAGTIMSPRITDSTGIARTTFDDIGLATEPDSSTVICRYARFSIADTIYIKILEMQPIGHITLVVNPENMIAGIDSASCIATVFQENLEFAPAGTMVIFNSDSGGTFSPSNVATLNTNGQATVYFKAPNATGITHITATCSGVISNEVMCHVNAGRARNLLVTVDPPELLANAGATAIVYVAVSDSLGNLVGSSELIYLNATLGYISGSASTINGIATTIYNPGTTAGISLITAHDIYGDSATTSVPIVSGGPNSITLTSSTSSITVAGVGGNEQAILTANVRDASGNAVPDGNAVYFRILNYASLGNINLNNHGIEDSALTAGLGNASVTLNSGTVSGPVVIRAWTFTDSTHTTQISATLSGISVGSGPPYYIIVGHNNVGVDGEAGNWVIDVHASVADRYSNPVSNGWAVFFSVTPDTANVMVDSVVTGNDPISGNGNAIPGNAYSQLSYNGAATFESISLRATCKISESDSVYGVETFQLPMQSCEVTLYCQPIAWHFGIPGQETYSRIKCMVTVRDGHLQPINNALILFFATRGQFYTAANGGQQVDTRLTGQPPDNPGEAVLWLRGYPAWVFPDPVTPEIPATVNAAVYGYQACITDGVQVLFQR